MYVCLGMPFEKDIKVAHRPLGMPFEKDIEVAHRPNMRCYCVYYSGVHAIFVNSLWILTQ